MVATDMGDLVGEVDGCMVEVSAIESVVLRTADVATVEIAPDWRNRFLGTITSPSVAYILMLIGFYGLLLEFYNPGTFIPGVAGAICLLMALYAFQMLPVNYVGVALIVLGIAFVIAEIFVSSFGALGAGGTIAFVVGSVMLMDTDVPEFRLPIGLIAGVSVVSLGLVVAIVVMALWGRRRPVVGGVEEMIGSSGEVIDDFEGRGWVRVHSENWTASSRSPLQRGQKVTVTEVNGLELSVVAANETKREGE